MIAVLLYACSDRRQSVTDFKEYESYLSLSQAVSSNPVNEELKFWNDRLKKNGDEASLIKLGALHSELFKETGLVEHIVLSDSLYKQAQKRNPDGLVEIYQALAANAISRHKFQVAKEYAEKALSVKDKKSASLLILADVSLEIGDYARANQILQQFKNKRSFAYLIRKAKVKDHEGMLDSAIACMEQAYQRVRGNKALSQWALSNLGDMYGHAGRIEESYAAYLTVLRNDPSDDYSLKGIAWIALSHDNKIKDAKRIINTLAARKRMPELHLMLAEIAHLEGKTLEKTNQLKIFRSLASAPAYRQMYLKYLALLEAEEFNNASAAVSMAVEEINNRSTPQSFDLLAWAYYHQNKFKEAFEVATKHVEHQTFEPDAVYHLGMIYHANGNHEKGDQYLKEALKSHFELGPSTAARIEAAIESL
jgi:predicted Zn-dependent protease